MQLVCCWCLRGNNNASPRPLFLWKIRGVEMCRSHWWAKLPATAMAQGPWEDASYEIQWKGQRQKKQGLS
jgi:hypothetical protein